MADKRKIITVSFEKDPKGYDYAKDQPNTSDYIRELVKKDMKNKMIEKTLEDKFEELKGYIDLKFNEKSTSSEMNELELEEDMKDSLLAFD